MIPETTATPESILAQIASIKRMEAGKLSVIRQGPEGPYYNLQHRENGRNHTEYIPKTQLPQAQAHVEAYQQFNHLMHQYVSAISQVSRQERKGADNKKRPSRTSQSPGKPKSKS